MGIDLNALYLAAATLLGEAVMTVIAFGLVYMVANTAYRWVRRGLADRDSGPLIGGVRFNDGDPLPGLSEEEYERQRLAAIDLDAEEEYQRELKREEDAYWRARGY